MSLLFPRSWTEPLCATMFLALCPRLATLHWRAPRKQTLHCMPALYLETCFPLSQPLFQKRRLQEVGGAPALTATWHDEGRTCSVRTAVRGVRHHCPSCVQSVVGGAFNFWRRVQWPLSPVALQLGSSDQCMTTNMTTTDAHDQDATCWLLCPQPCLGPLCPISRLHQRSFQPSGFL